MIPEVYKLYILYKTGGNLLPERIAAFEVKRDRNRVNQLPTFKSSPSTYHLFLFVHPQSHLLLKLFFIYALTPDKDGSPHLKQ